MKVEWVGEPTISNGVITANVKVTTGVSPADFKAKIEPTGSYNDAMLNVTDIRLFVSQLQYVGVGSGGYDNRYSTQISYGGNSFDAQLGQTITISTTGEVEGGKSFWIRAAARINYSTENVRRYNYNAEVRVNIPR